MRKGFCYHDIILQVCNFFEKIFVKIFSRMHTALRNVFICLNPTLFTQLMKPDNNDIITEPHINNKIY